MNKLIGSQSFHWSQYYGDRNENLEQHLDEVFSVLQQAGITAWEQSIASEADVELVGGLLHKYGIQLPTIYAGGILHDEDWEQTAQSMVTQAKWGKSLGATIVVSNPNPISWSENIDKTDVQLRQQALALQTLTSEITAMGMTLAYHVHAPEMRQSAREMHHMLLATREHGMKFCLDFHWLYRGAGNSQVAVEDIMDLYGERIVTTHIRQSHGGVWSESLEDGDINYVPLVSKLRELNYDGPLVIECAREEGTHLVESMREAYTTSRAWIESTFLA